MDSFSLIIFIKNFGIVSHASVFQRFSLLLLDPEVMGSNLRKNLLHFPP
jgi:hypothetical protein